MKHKMYVVLIAVALLEFGGIAYADVVAPTLIVNGNTINTSPVIINGRVYVPVRAIAEAMNCQVNWDSSSQTVNITSNPAPIPDSTTAAPTTTTAPTQNSNSNNQSQPDLQISNVTSQTDGNGSITEIDGTITNNSQNNYSMVYIEYNLYDSSGDEVGYANDIVSDFESGTKAKFSCQYGNSGATSYKLTKLTYHM